MKIRDLALMALFIVLIIIGTFTTIPLPLCPINLQPFFVVLAGLMLGGKKGAFSVLGFVLLGLTGVPVFTHGGGISYVLQPTFGFMLGYIFAALIIGGISSSGKPTVRRYTMAGLCGLAAVYGVGLVYYWCISRYYLQSDIGVWTMLVSCFFVPLPKDIVMCIPAAVLAKRLLPIIRSTEYKNQVKFKEDKND